ncbi:PLAC8 family-domain-containing protein [Bisporella sp. PMI_857]|nr:PLAC8 family-domain-containing protein [Bisporella sp. PMI_857]
MSGTRKYNSSLFGCCTPVPLCFKAWCCPCLVYGRNHYRAEHGTDQGYDTCNGWCAAYCGLLAVGGWGWILQCLTRRDMQQRMNLEGSGCGACCASFCCSCCELVQTSKELDYIALSQGKSLPPQGYQSHPGMVADQKVSDQTNGVHNTNGVHYGQGHPTQPQLALTQGEQYPVYNQQPVMHASMK